MQLDIYILIVLAIVVLIVIASAITLGKNNPSVIRVFFDILFKVVGGTFILSPIFLYGVAISASSLINQKKESDLNAKDAIGTIEVIYSSPFLYIILPISLLALAYSLFLWKGGERSYGLGAQFRRLFLNNIDSLMVPGLWGAFGFYASFVTVVWVSKAVVGDVAAGYVIDPGPAMGASFTVYITIFSVFSVIRAFHLNHTVQTGILPFIEQVTAELDQLNASKTGTLLVSAPWLSIGSHSVVPSKFQAYEDALRDCCTNRNIQVQMATIETGKVTDRIDKSSVDQKEKDRLKDTFTDTEDRMRSPVKDTVTNTKLYEIKETDVLNFFCFADRIFIFSMNAEKAAKQASLERAFFGTRVHDPAIIDEYRTMFKESIVKVQPTT